MTDDPDGLRRAADRLAYKFGADVARQMLRDLGAAQAVRYLDDAERRRLIRTLRAQHEPVADIRAALVRKGMSRTAAYELIWDELSRNGPESGRAGASIGR